MRPEQVRRGTPISYQRDCLYSERHGDGVRYMREGSLVRPNFGIDGRVYSMSHSR